MTILGISSGFHDAAATVISNSGDVLFAAHSDRYSKIKNDPNIDPQLMREAWAYGVDTIAYYERPLFKQARQWYSGQGIEWNKLTVRQILEEQCGMFYLEDVKLKNYNHHLCHAAAGFQTSPYTRATVVVIDAIGEWETVSIWGAEYVNGRAKYKKLWTQQYPHSIGLLYSAMTKYVGLTPNEDEYILMGMAAYGDKTQKPIGDEFVSDFDNIVLSQNLHRGIPADSLGNSSDFNIAASTQEVTERLISSVMKRARDFKWSSNLVYMGGVALNCLANRHLGDQFDSIWIMPNPGDAGSSLGAAALAYGGRVNWRDAFLGHNIQGPYPVDGALACLLDSGIVGIASGRAEFGPRALGNRSLLADPRSPDIKERVNAIKQRQQFRPFAPVILEELADTYFDMPSGWSNSRYMQSVAHCRRPDLFPAIVHHDGTSRVQTVPQDGSGIRQLLEKWYAVTNCPMLLNTSLNVKGEPIVNDRLDADKFERLYGVQVLS